MVINLDPDHRLVGSLSSEMPQKGVLQVAMRCISLVVLYVAYIISCSRIDKDRSCHLNSSIIRDNTSSEGKYFSKMHILGRPGAAIR